MEKRPRKLTLSKETLRTLDDKQLEGVVGGATGVCVLSVVCHSGICGSAVCHSGAVCNSVIC